MHHLHGVTTNVHTHVLNWTHFAAQHWSESWTGVGKLVHHLLHLL